MAGCRIPGAGGGPLSLAMDEGTSCLTTALSPKAIGVAPLTFDQSTLTDARRTLFRFVVQEALRRGAKTVDLDFVRTKYLITLEVGDTPLSNEARLSEYDATTEIIEKESAAFQSIIQGELELMENKWPDPKGRPFRLEDYQYVQRPLYYEHGYSDPVAFLMEQVQHRLLDGLEPMCVHQEFAERLSGLAGVLRGWSPHLNKEISTQVRGGIGLQIRTIAGKNVLSNHAFGFAVDIDAYGNPHVVGDDVVSVFNSMANRAGCSYDFGKAGLTSGERGHKHFNEDDVMELYNRALNASNAVRDALRADLPRYRQLIEKIKSAEAALGIRSATHNTTLERRLQDAEKARAKLLKDREAVARQSLTEIPEDSFVAIIRSTIDRIGSEAELQHIQLLHERFSDAKYIDTWEKRGIMNLPLYLVIALVAKLDLRWGEQYETSKDAMHFELLGIDGKTRIAPDNAPAKHEAPRTLSRLKSESFGQGALKWKLAPPQLLANLTHRW